MDSDPAEHRHRDAARADPHAGQRGAARPGVPRKILRRLRAGAALSDGRDRRPAEGRRLGSADHRRSGRHHPRAGAPHGGDAHHADRVVVAAARRPRRAAVLGADPARRLPRPDRPAGRRLRLRLWLRRRHRASRRWRSRAPTMETLANPLTPIPAARITDCLLIRASPTTSTARGHLSRHPAGLLGGRQSVPSSPGHQPAARAPGSSPRPSSCTSRGGPRPRAMPTSCCRPPRRSSATTSAARRATRFIIAMQQAIAPVGEARNDFAIFSELARRLGCDAAYTEGATR